MVVQMDSELREYAELANVLWRERETMTLVIFKVVEERLVVASGQTRWLADANRELEAALSQLRTTDVLRAVESDALAERLGLPPGSGLQLLAECSIEPWSTILFEHRDALGELADQLRDAVEAVTADLTSQLPSDSLVHHASLRTTVGVHQTSLLDYLSNSSPSS
jgi:hypothetical protein